MSANVIALPRPKREIPQLNKAAVRDTALSVELRRARIRIAQLEASLTEAMRDSLRNFDRAREAEKRLARMQARLRLTGVAED